MKQSHYTDSQILAILKQAESGTPVTDRTVYRGIKLVRSMVQRKTNQIVPWLSQSY